MPYIMLTLFHRVWLIAAFLTGTTVNATLAQHHVTIPMLRFSLRFDAIQQPSADDCVFSKLTVLRRPSGTVVQTIPFDAETSLSLDCQRSAGILANIVDANNDGNQDFLALSFSAATNQLYDFWLYRPATGKFRRVLTRLSNPTVNRAKKEIRAVHQNGVGSSETTVYRYKGTTFHRYELVTRDFDEQVQGFRVVVKRLVNGHWRVVRRYIDHN